jgi:hypothetical protein
VPPEAEMEKAVMLLLVALWFGFSYYLLFGPNFFERYFGLIVCGWLAYGLLFIPAVFLAFRRLKSR